MTELLTSVYTCFANLACKNGFYRHLRMICCCLGRERGLCTNQLTDDLSACTGFAARAAANPCRWKGCLSRSINSCPFQNCSRLCIVCCSAYAYIHKIEKEFPGLATKLLCICIFTYVRKERDNTVVSFLLPPTNFSFFPLVAAAFLWNKVPRILYSTCGTMFVNDGGFVTDICKSAATEERAVRDYKSCEVDQLTCHGPSKLGQVAMVSLQMYPTSIVIRGAMLQNAPWWRAVRCRNGELVLKQGPTWAQRMTFEWPFNLFFFFFFFRDRPSINFTSYEGFGVSRAQNPTINSRELPQMTKPFTAKFECCISIILLSLPCQDEKKKNLSTLFPENNVVPSENCVSQK